MCLALFHVKIRNGARRPGSWDLLSRAEPPSRALAAPLHPAFHTAMARTVSLAPAEVLRLLPARLLCPPPTSSQAFSNLNLHSFP